MTGRGFKAHFSRFLDADPNRLHVAAHSHHPWPNITFEAQQENWLDAATRMDDKWDHIFGEVLPTSQRHIARVLHLSDPASIAFAPNTHEFVLRILSCLPTPARILTTDSEFHSFRRQTARLEEEGLAEVERIPAEPFATFPDRLRAAAAAGGHHLVFVSHVLFNSGYVLPDLPALVEAVPDDDTFVVLDGYHSFLALPTDLSAIEDRAFYVSGGYKYAMAGEGVCFLHCPPGYGERPVNTGWYAGFGQLESGVGDRVGYSPGGQRFAGATFDPSGLYRFNAVCHWLTELGLSVAAIHAHVRALEDAFLDRLGTLGLDRLRPEMLVPGVDEVPDRGHFLTFRTPEAGVLYRALHDRRVITDHRDDRLRFGFGIYHDETDLDVLVERLELAIR